MNFNEKSKDFKQVRQTGGGGVRHLIINKTLVVQTLLEHAKETCFPFGNSKLGSVEEFDIEIRNFQGTTIDKEMNINDLYIASKLKILRVYMYTKKKTEKGPGSPGLSSSVQECGTLSDSESLPYMMGKYLTGEFAVSTQAAFTLASPESETSEFTGSTQAAFTLSSPDSETTNTTWSTPESFNLASPDPEVNFNPRSYGLSLRRRSGTTATTTVSGSHSAGLTCQSIITEIEILDSEGEEIQSALLESMQHQIPSTISDDSTEPSVADILQEFRNRYIKDDHTNCVISRSKPLDSAIRL
ncbi:uncharacterized protein LOC127838578 [Dreissena polymorpha]|uniref:Uncharacterized protein n=1 Tax=Dreissena polymorpha TaxID=45954 RepID=A0A9D4JB03_DREPO|nr:uncharacterized protein LOC127838578 [Dreissena polymorpha]KAH3801397.1 hypothetical protein DPMN_155047 [Dreissena polymorpha]